MVLDPRRGNRGAEADAIIDIYIDAGSDAMVGDLHAEAYAFATDAYNYNYGISTSSYVTANADIMLESGATTGPSDWITGNIEAISYAAVDDVDAGRDPVAHQRRADALGLLRVLGRYVGDAG